MADERSLPFDVADSPRHANLLSALRCSTDPLHARARQAIVELLIERAPLKSHEESAAAGGASTGPDDPYELVKFCGYLATKPGARAVRLRRAVALLWNARAELLADKTRLRAALEELIEATQTGNDFLLASARVNARSALHLTSDRPAMPAVTSPSRG